MRNISQKRFRRTTVIIWGLIAFLVGLGLARLKISISVWLIGLGFMAVVLTFKVKNMVALGCVIAFGLLLGLWRGNVYLDKLSSYKSLYYSKVSIVGKASTDGAYEKSQLAFDLIDAQVGDLKLVGKVGIRGFGANSVFRGDLIQAEGKLYPARGSRQATISYAKINVLQTSDSLINTLRRKFEAGMLTALPEPMASFGLGLLIGQRSTLPDSVSDELSAVGLTHIVAVSGYNLTIIIGAVYLMLKKFSKYQATAGSVLLIILFILFAGSSASIIRASIVSLLSLWAAYYGRSFKPVMLILMAATLTAAWSPLYLWSDIGWYLSFLAFYGILVLSPLLLRRIYGQKTPKILPILIIETIAAQLMTIPIVMYIFGRVSLVALPANILVVPFVPIAMALSFIAALAGMLIPSLAGWLAWPARILLTYMLDMVSLFAKIPHALGVINLNLTQLIALYGFVVVLCLLLWFKNKSKNDIITDELTEEI